MKLPTEVSPGMVAWLADPADASGRATPACITAVNATLENGAFSPFVRVRRAGQSRGGGAGAEMVECEKHAACRLRIET